MNVQTSNAAYDNASFDLTYFETLELDQNMNDNAENIAIEIDQLSDSQALAYLDTIKARSNRSFMNRVYCAVENV